MNDRPKDRHKNSRNRRLSAALRDNLKRRKAQARGREAAGDAESAAERPAEPHDSAGITSENPQHGPLRSR